MFVGRKRELAALERHFNTGRFEMAVVYGRRRVGKTFLLSEFAKGKRCLFFTAVEKSDEINLRNFSDAVFELFGVSGLPAFSSWSAALAFVAAHASDLGSPLLFVFDELPYAAKANPSLPSMLQASIDHDFLATDVCMVLCGSNQGFMESEVLGGKSPLYGRRTMQVKLEPFTFFEALPMLPRASTVDLVHYYATFGGTPYYLSQIDSTLGYLQNVRELLFDPYGVLFAEPEMLLRQELREVALYQSILDAIGSGATLPKQIAERAGIDKNSAGKYLATLAGLGIVRRDVPYGEHSVRSKRGLWHMADPFFAFWYRFVSPFTAAVERNDGSAVIAQVLTDEPLETHTGLQFETICQQWVEKEGHDGSLGFVAAYIGKWWGTDPVARERADVDVVAADAFGKEMLLGECKWRNTFDESEALRLLAQRADAFAGSARRTYMLFCKQPVSEGTHRKAAAREDLRILTAEDLVERA